MIIKMWPNFKACFMLVHKFYIFYINLISLALIISEL